MLLSAIILLLLTSTVLAILFARMGDDGSPAYSVGSWNPALGNHRILVRVGQQADSVQVHVPWRLRDKTPQDKHITVIDAATNSPVDNVARIEVNREFCHLAFQPVSGPGEYHIHYFPSEVTGWQAMPEVGYPPPHSDADEQWLRRNGLATDQLRHNRHDDLPCAELVDIQARMEFHRKDPMEVIATQQEVCQLLEEHPGEAVLIFPEDREHPIRMTGDLPARWIERGPSGEFSATAHPGEFFAFQLGLYAARASVNDVDVEFSSLCTRRGDAIPASAIRCFNMGGLDWAGRPFQKTVSVQQGEVQPLWFGVDIPADAPTGQYEGTLTLKLDDAEQVVRLSLTVAGDALKDRGDDDPHSFSRLRWLDSTLGLDDEIVAPYTPLEVDSPAVRCLDREVAFGGTALPESIRSRGNEILSSPVAFVVETTEGPVKWTGGAVELSKQTPGQVVLESSSIADPFELHCRVEMEFDGHVSFQLALRATRSIEVNDVHLDIPLRREIAKYMMGLGRKGGMRPEKWRWKWNQELRQDSVWLGDVDAGLQCKLKGPDYERPLVNIYYHHKPLVIPEAWSNAGNGGCDILEEGGSVVVRAHSGPRTVQTGQELRFDFDLLVTPFKPIDYKAHWAMRYFHPDSTPFAMFPDDEGHLVSLEDGPLDKAAQAGANIVNFHHGNELNPYINYPFLRIDKLKAYVDGGHQRGLKVKIYYTVRELSNHVVEMPALRSLGHEVLASGPGGGDSWLQEHLGGDYIPAWRHCFDDGDVDAAIITSGMSRWHNYYVEGLAWLLRNVGIDGIYIDDVAYDRQVMKRVRKVFDRLRPGCLIDVHSCSHYQERFGNASSANVYMEHFPYVNSLWFGEGFEADEPPDFWLVETSGIPFGLMGEQLQTASNPWRGMLYGMVPRLPWSGDPRHVWKVWDEFGIQESRMIGYWQQACPVKTDNEDIMATAYVRHGKAMLVSLASWAAERADCRLQIDWKAIGLDPRQAAINAPQIDGFQDAATFGPSDAIPVEAGRGWLLIVEPDRT